MGIEEIGEVPDKNEKHIKNWRQSDPCCIDLLKVELASDKIGNLAEISKQMWRSVLVPVDYI